MNARLEIASRLLVIRTINPKAIGDVLKTADELIKANRVFSYLKDKTPLCEADQKIAEAAGLVDPIGEQAKTDPGPDRTWSCVCMECGLESRRVGRKPESLRVYCHHCKKSTEHKFTEDPS